MPVETPDELSYYYECSYGDFRLVYHIPFNILKDMVENGEIKEEALRDFPDGIDLDCYEPDYQEFNNAYGYHPPADPEAVKRAFVTLFNELENWSTFKGSGVIKADYLEGLVEKVDKTLEARDIHVPSKERKSEPTSIQERREIQKAQVKEQNDLHDALKKISLSDLDIKKPDSLKELKPEMTDGDSPESIFIQAQRGGRRKPR